MCLSYLFYALFRGHNTTFYGITGSQRNLAETKTNVLILIKFLACLWLRTSMSKMQFLIFLTAWEFALLKMIFFTTKIGDNLVE